MKSDCQWFIDSKLNKEIDRHNVLDTCYFIGFLSEEVFGFKSVFHFFFFLSSTKKKFYETIKPISNDCTHWTEPIRTKKRKPANNTRVCKIRKLDLDGLINQALLNLWKRKRAKSERRRKINEKNKTLLYLIDTENGATYWPCLKSNCEYRWLIFFCFFFSKMTTDFNS